MRLGRDGENGARGESTPHNERIQKLVHTRSWVPSKDRRYGDRHVCGNELEFTVASLALALLLCGLDIGFFEFLLWLAALCRACLSL